MTACLSQTCTCECQSNHPPVTQTDRSGACLASPEGKGTTLGTLQNPLPTRREAAPLPCLVTHSIPYKSRHRLLTFDGVVKGPPCRMLPRGASLSPSPLLLHRRREARHLPPYSLCAQHAEWMPFPPASLCKCRSSARAHPYRPCSSPALQTKSPLGILDQTLRRGGLSVNIHHLSSTVFRSH